MSPGASPLVFISYSHNDRKIIDVLRKHLQVIAQEHPIELWDDTRIRVGDDWLPQIQTALAKAQIAILLISKNFLTSKFIHASEIPALLEKRAREGLWLIPVLVDHCRWAEVPWLSQIQALTKFGQPITTDEDRESYFADLAKQIAHQLRSNPPTLAITHIEHSNPPAFSLTRLSENISLPPVTVPAPYTFPVADQPNSNLMHQLRWYLEEFLDYPFHPDTLRAEHILDALKLWGTQSVHALFDQSGAENWLTTATVLQIRSDDAQVLSWPWEALHDPQLGYLAHHVRIERRLTQLCKPEPLAKNLPNDRVNILLVVCRPYEDDVRYRSLARPLIELIQTQHLPAHVDVLRPPTFDQLRAHLRAHPNHYHAIHFDGHGSYAADAPAQPSPHLLKAREGRLIFETAQGAPDPKSAAELTTLLREHAVPAVVLNACQSGMLGPDADTAFASVATALLRSGMRSVVAMAYSLYVSGAQVFLPAFYRRLFEAGSIAEAVREGRREMLAHPDRVCVRGRYPLNDWLLPVLYQQDPASFEFARHAQLETRASRLPAAIRDYHDPYGFIGRDSAILKMERALHRKTPCILVRGLGGVGKTTLARGFLRWLDETGGLDGALWFDFRDIRTAEYVLNQTGQAFYGENFGIAKNKLELLAEALRDRRVLMVWDNFESTATNLPTEDRAQLGQFLDAIHGCRGKVVLTSRTEEEWLGATRRVELILGGLDGEERWEYCETILRELDIKVDRNDPALKGLMDQLHGHPLAMRVVLPKIEKTKAAKVAEALRTNIAELGLNVEEEQGRLFATLRFTEQGLAEDLRPLLGLMGLHEGFVSAFMLEHMAKQVDAAWTRQRIDRLMAALGSAGLVRDIGRATFEMHPLLTSYLRAEPAAAHEPSQRAFVEIMGSLADELARSPLHEQRVPFLLHAANFNFALDLATRLDMDQQVLYLTQSLGVFALNSRNFTEASRLFQRVARHGAGRGFPEYEASAYNQLGVIAQEQRDFETAREWYVKSLAIKENQGNLHGASRTYHQLGMVAEEQHEFEAAREWYLKSLAISEKQGNLHGASLSYHQLGRIAEEQGEFETARGWYIKSLAIKEKQTNLHGAAITYHQLGMVAEKQGEFEAARGWYLKSLAIKEKHGDVHGVASTYHQLGMVAERQGEFETAREWSLKSLAVSEKQGNLHGAAITYHQLGMIAEKQGEFETAREWYLKSLAIEENQGNLHAAAITYGQLGNLAGLQENYVQSAKSLIRSCQAFLQMRDEYSAKISVHNLLIFYNRASPDEKTQIEALWHEAELGTFPTPPNP